METHAREERRSSDRRLSAVQCAIRRPQRLPERDPMPSHGSAAHATRKPPGHWRGPREGRVDAFDLLTTRPAETLSGHVDSEATGHPGGRWPVDVRMART